MIKKVKEIISFLILSLTVMPLGLIVLSSPTLAHGNSVVGRLESVDGGKVPILKELLYHNFPVTTKNQAAQQYFNQGLVLTYGFDHSDAELSFLEAAKYDPDCAMAYWGVALVLGPNINSPMDDAEVPRAYEMAQKALSLSKKVSPKERALIEALVQRYGPTAVNDRSSLDQAFAKAMQKVYAKFPADPDVAVLYAEALMDEHPWDYWTTDGSPQPWTHEIKKTLESVISKFPNHPHGHHLYIHLMENSSMPEVAVKSADVIGKLAPASGHLVHMAAHAYYAAGFYHECSMANERAMEVDKTLISSFETSGLYQTGYVPHVQHYLLASYMMEGRSSDAVRTARTLSESIDTKKMREPGGGTLQHFYLTPYYTLVRFGFWKEILNETPPPKDLLYPLGMWHYARGIAFIRLGNTGRAEKELNTLREISKDKSLDSVMIWDINKSSDLLAIASEVLEGDLAAAQGKNEEAVAHLKKAVGMEDNLPFDEPPPWYYPVRQSLGAVLLDLGKVKEAELVFRKDLLKNAENPWSLFGLAESLKKQGDTDILLDTQKRFRRAWSRSDLQLKRSVF